MSLTVGEVLENANYNIQNQQIPLQGILAKQQLNNYKIAKDLGADDNDNWYDWEEKVEKYKEENE